MTIAQTGLAFRVDEWDDDVGALVSALFDAAAVEVPAPFAHAFDPRNAGDVMVQRFGDVCFVCNGALAAPLLDDAPAPPLHRSLGTRDWLFAFRHDDTTGHYGYAVFERGEHRRTRLQSGTADGPPALTERGEPLPFERRWLGAPHFVDRPEAPSEAQGKVYYLGHREVLVREQQLTGRLLREGLESHFEVCPWETLMTPTYRFFRLDGAAAVPAPGSPAPPKPSRPWWKWR